MSAKETCRNKPQTAIDLGHIPEARRYSITRYALEIEPILLSVSGAQLARNEGSRGKASLPGWTTVKRPYFKLDCETLFKTSELKEETTPLDQFLDIGCGSGDLTLSVVKQHFGPHRVIVATESSQEAVEALRKSVLEKDILFQQFDVERDVGDAILTWGRFRRVFCLYQLDKARNRRAALANIRELLVDDGELFLLYLVDSNLRGILEGLSKSARWREVAKVSAG